MIKIAELYKIYLSNPLISTDSRRIQKDCLFFALKGENFDGNKFAVEALKKGAAYAIVDDENIASNDNRLILVDNTLTALQKLANYHRKTFQFPVIALTGTNGKTSTKDLIKTILSAKYKTVATKGNLNNHIGVPLTLLEINPKETEICIIEMGANHINDIQELCAIADPDYGLVTCIGKAHLEGFKSVQNIINTKTDLYRWIKAKNGLIFVNGDDEILMKYLSENKYLSYGSQKDKNNYYCYAKLNNDKIIVELDWYKKTKKYHIKTQLYGRYNFLNALAAICVADYFGLSPDEIVKSLSGYKQKNNRSEIKKIDTNTYICDAYNANPSSMMQALKTFEDYKSENKIVVLGDMLELGECEYIEHKIIVDYLKTLNLERVFLVGERFKKAAQETTFETFKDVYEAKESIKLEEFKNKVILIKGSRGMSLELLYC